MLSIHIIDLTDLTDQLRSGLWRFDVIFSMIFRDIHFQPTTLLF
jgi:hypothetical protein